MSEQNTKNTSRRIKEYLATLTALTQNGKGAKASELAKQMRVSPSTAIEMLKKMAAQGFVDYSPYRRAAVTDEGLKIVERMRRKQRLLEYFLFDVLKIEKNSAHLQACEMEHYLSDEAEAALCSFIAHLGECSSDAKSV
jgi:DtxR family Mn-dependent transcriptional regulator